MSKQDDLNNMRVMLEGKIVISPDGIKVLDKPVAPEKHTEEIQEIITKVPSWLIRWGIGMVFSSLLLIVIISVLVPYPNTVKSVLKVKPFTYVTPVLTDSGGRITKVFVNTNTLVKQGQPLIEIEKENKSKFIVKAPTSGTVGFSTIIQPDMTLGFKQEMFKLHPVNERFYGVMQVTKAYISGIKTGQQVLVKPAGATQATAFVIKGKVDFVADEPVNELFLIKVVFDEPANNKYNIKSWMDFEGQIITKKSNLFLKFFGGVVDVYNSI